MKPIIIFGTGTMAKLALHCFRQSEAHRVSAFCVDDAFLSCTEFEGLPVVRFSQLERDFPQDSYRIFVGLGYQKLNAVRRDFFQKFESMGYEFASCISPRAIIMNDHAIGRNCFIMEGVTVQAFSCIGDNCIFWSGSVVSHDSVIGNNCFLAANCVVGGMAKIGDNCFLGINSTVRDRIHIGEKCLVGAGGLVLQNLAAGSLVVENATPVASVSAEQALRFIDI